HESYRQVDCGWVVDSKKQSDSQFLRKKYILAFSCKQERRATKKERPPATRNKEVDESRVKKQGTLAALTHRRLSMYSRTSLNLTEINSTPPVNLTLFFVKHGGPQNIF
ncbi:unnamed protein product, partial [Ectocarpus sp. 13 AM-2016]